MSAKPIRPDPGERQRAAMGRAIVREPKVFLMDEPLSNLDAQLRVQTRSEIAAMQSRLGTTTVYVTHDQVEAMTMGHRVAVLRDGVLQQVVRGAAHIMGSARCSIWLPTHDGGLVCRGAVGDTAYTALEGRMPA